MNKKIKYEHAKYALDHLGDRLPKKNNKDQGSIQEVDENKPEQRDGLQEYFPKIDNKNFVLDCVTGKMPKYNSKQDRHLQHFYIRKKLIKLLRKQEITTLYKTERKSTKKGKASQSVNVTRNNFFKNNLRKDLSSERKIKSRSSQKTRTQTNTKQSKPWRTNIRISKLRKVNRYTSRNKNTLSKKNKTERVLSTQNSKDGIFLTSVEDGQFENSNKENLAQSDLNRKEKERPVFSNANKKSK